MCASQQQRRERELRKQQEREQRKRYEEMEQLRREEERRHAEREQVHMYTQTHIHYHTWLIVAFGHFFDEVERGQEVMERVISVQLFKLIYILVCHYKLTHNSLCKKRSGNHARNDN